MSVLTRVSVLALAMFASHAPAGEIIGRIRSLHVNLETGLADLQTQANRKERGGMTGMVRTLCTLLIGLLGAGSAMADWATGKVVTTQGHVVPACRTVVLKENGTGTLRLFRIADPGTGPDSIAAVLLAALVSRNDVSIYYETAQTTGCGTEPKILVVSIDAAA
jgi:hypothetical protein